MRVFPLVIQFFYMMSQFQNSSKLSKRSRFDLRKGAFSAVKLPFAALCDTIFAIWGIIFEIASNAVVKNIIYLLLKTFSSLQG